MIRELIRRTARGLGEHPYVSVVGTAVITTALTLVGAWALASLQIEALLGAWEQDAHVSAWLKPEITPEARAALEATVRARPEVLEVRYVGEDEAAAWLKTRMPEVGPVLDDLGSAALPASLEITLRPGDARPEVAEALATVVLAELAVESVDYGAEWVGQAQGFLQLFRSIGLAFGLVVALATLFLVANTVHLGVYARRDEVEIMRLVGATDGYIIAPFAAEGAFQGALGATLATALLAGLHALLASRTGEVFAAVIGKNELPFLPTAWLVGLALLGTTVGAVAHAVSVHRFLGRVP